MRPLFRGAEVLVLQNYRPERPERLRHFRVIPRVRRWLDEDAVVPQRDALREGIVGLKEMPAWLVVAGDIIADAQQRVRKVFPVQVDVLLHDGRRALGRHPLLMNVWPSPHKPNVPISTKATLGLPS